MSNNFLNILLKISNAFFNTSLEISNDFHNITQEHNKLSKTICHKL